MPLAQARFTQSLDVDLTLQAERVAALLEGFVLEETTKVGLERLVVGLSGGVDSALAASIAVRALGPENVLGVLMPYASSHPDSLADAEALAELLGIDTELHDITPQIDAYFATEPEAGRIRRGNKMARERMTILYDLSARDEALVLGTSNKTELLLGYSTLHGDSASAINPNGDLYKTQIFQMAAYYAVPEAILAKTPSADLWEGQSTEGELGFALTDVDRALYLLVDQRMAPRDLIALGVDEGFVTALLERVRWAQFKRLPALIAKVSERTVGIDFRYLRDWGR